jgi:methylenetetrahydrofolate dehydrogenase (NADP+)/methenyltetrahydrofolate cyclohydrolase
MPILIQGAMATILSGTDLAERLREQIGAAAEAVQANGIIPSLATILVGDNPASASYIRSKQRTSERLGISGIDIRLPADTTQEELLIQISELNQRSDVHGILVQQPLPDHIDTETVVEAVSPEKDVDGLHPVNLGRLMRSRRCFLPCTPNGVTKLLEAGGIQVSGSRVAIIGRSLLVGKPLAELLLLKQALGNATVTVCHSGTRDLATITREADIVIAAIGRAEFVTADMVKPGATVIDVGINRVDDASRKRGYRLVGDVAFGEVEAVAGAITPVPGGVGPMTVTMLMYNTVQSAAGLRSQDPLPGGENR